ncbi:MAG: exo-alpha-sialidase, partial [bacterium]|nr:exo-alpha-sialidase [bacterium]
NVMYPGIRTIILMLPVLFLLVSSACKPGSGSDSGSGGEEPNPLEFSPVTIVDSRGIGQRGPRVAIDNNGNVYVSWNQIHVPASQVMLKKSTNGGFSFFRQLIFRDVTGGDIGLDSFLIADRNRNLYLSWSSSRDPSCFPGCSVSKMYFTKSTDGGDSFSANIPSGFLASDDITQIGGKMAIGSDGTIYAAWNELSIGQLIDYIYLSRSTDGGVSFSARKQLYPNPMSRSKPGIIVDQNDHLYIAWMRYENGNRRIIEVIKSEDKGVSFSPPVRVFDADAVDLTDQDSPSLAVDNNGNLHIAWVGEENSLFVIYTAGSTDGGLTFSNPRR